MPITILALVLGVVGIVGYLMPETGEATPTRVLLPNTGGAVVFNHKEHAEKFGIACEKCHHEQKPGSKSAMPCGHCHPVEFTDAYLKDHQEKFAGNKEMCQMCHHMSFTERSKYDHDAHNADYTPDCTDCHHDTDIEETPTNCNECHDQKGSEGMPSVRDAVHSRCATCHEDAFDEKLAGCTHCHNAVGSGAGASKGHADVNVPCESCHYQEEKSLIPARGEMFHESCMGCHKKMGKGPYDKAACNKCHIK